MLDENFLAFIYKKSSHTSKCGISLSNDIAVQKISSHLVNGQSRIAIMLLPPAHPKLKQKINVHITISILSSNLNYYIFKVKIIVLFF